MVHVLMGTIKAPSEGTCIKGLLKKPPRDGTRTQGSLFSILVIVYVVNAHYKSSE